MGMFLKEVFANMCIMFALLFLCEQVVYRQQNLEKSTLEVSVKIGCITGVFGCILMVFKMSFFGSVSVDYRSIAIVLSALTGGVGAVIITGVIMAIFRLFVHGISFVSIVAMASILIAVSGCGFLIGKLNAQRQKWIVLYSYTTLCTAIAITIVMPRDVLLVETLVTMIGINVVGGLIGYWLYQYVHSIEEDHLVLKSQVHIDSLTQIYNRRYFEVALQSSINTIKSKGKERLALVILDIDHFKYINDTYGHIAGDQVLRQLAGICKKYVTLPATVYRIGGEEFAVIVPWNTYESAQDIAEQLRKQIKAYPFSITNDEVIQATVSLGVASYPQQVSSPYDLFAAADEALYEAKETGRNRVKVYSMREYKQS